MTELSTSKDFEISVDGIGQIHIFSVYGKETMIIKDVDALRQMQKAIAVALDGENVGRFVKPPKVHTCRYCGESFTGDFCDCEIPF